MAKHEMTNGPGGDIGDDHPPEHEDEARRLLEAGAGLLPEIGGSLSGAIVGTVVGGPVGAIAGAIAGPPVGRTLEELAHRLLGRRERARVGAAAFFALEEMKRLLDSGAEPRHDGFFDGAHPTAEEVLEGVLLKARDSYEEKKVRHLGYLYASVAFTFSISDVLANRLIHIAGDLTYRQYVMLAMIDNEADRRAFPPNIERPADGQFTYFTLGLLDELFDLHDRRYIGVEDSDLGKLTTYMGIDPSKLRLYGVGAIFASAARLDLIPPEDRWLRWPGDRATA